MLQNGIAFAQDLTVAVKAYPWAMAFAQTKAIQGFAVPTIPAR
jgi:hypothetical protein